LLNKTEWDSVAIIRPYLKKEHLNAFDLTKGSQIKDSMEYVTNVEWAQGLLFFMDGQVANYSVIPGNPSFQAIDISSRVAIPILTRSQCEVSLITVLSSANDRSYFFIPSDYSNGSFEYKTTVPTADLESVLDSLLLNKLK
jgi:hypothetical protein